jgi:hypothetical protein
MESIRSDPTGPPVINMEIFAFLGPARAGKTTAADVLEKRLVERGFYVERLSMAAPIKDGMRRVGVTKEDNPVEYRSLAQRWGSTRRERNADHYINKAARRIERFRSIEKKDYDKLDGQDMLSCWDETAIIFDDIRYPNEVNLMKSLGATQLWVNAGERINFSDAFRQHESETLANHLANDIDALEAFLVDINGWELDASGTEQDTARQIATYLERIWFGTFAYLGGINAFEQLMEDLEDEDDSKDPDND